MNVDSVTYMNDISTLIAFKTRIGLVWNIHGSYGPDSVPGGSYEGRIWINQRDG